MMSEKWDVWMPFIRLAPERLGWEQDNRKIQFPSFKTTQVYISNAVEKIKINRKI